MGKRQSSPSRSRLFHDEKDEVPMKTGRLFAALAAAVLSAFCISVTVSADAEKDSYDFYTYFDFEEEMSEGLYNDFIEFETDGIYLPVEYNVTNISWVSLRRYSYRLDLENADTDYIGSFCQYFDKESYDSRIDSDRKKTGTQGRRLTYRGTELTVFTHGLYDHNENNDELDPSGFDKEETEHEKEDSIKQSCICWTENGHYFVVETLLDPEDPAVLELTHYRKARFNSGVVRRNNKLVYLDKKGRIVKNKDGRHGVETGIM